MSDYLTDLRAHSPEAVELACRAWRQTAAKSFPKVGELVPLVYQHAPTKVDDQGGAWAPLDDEAYRYLSLREKVRYHKIAANEAGRAAGPMWKNGAPATPDQLGEKWARYTKIKANHLAEVTRLTKALEDYQEKVGG